MCSVECGDGVLSHGNMPVSTPSITTHSQGLSLLIALTSHVCVEEAGNVRDIISKVKYIR
jgi:hypothetical protein